MRSQIKRILISTSILVLISIGFLYVRTQRKQSLVGSSGSALTINPGGVQLVKNYREVLGQQLPPFSLATASGEKLSEDVIRQGNVVLIFIASDCKACTENSDSFKTIVSMRNDVRYFGVRPYDKKSQGDETYVNIVPFAVYFDVDHKLSRHLGIRGVPVAVFVKDGGIKRIWGGAVIDEREKTEFNSWLSSVYG